MPKRKRMFSDTLRWAMDSTLIRTQQAVVDVLCALRGPDNHETVPFDDDPKPRYTCPVRCWAYGLTPNGLIQFGAGGGTPPPESISEWEDLLNTLAGRSTNAGWHYANHMSSAIRGIIHIEKEWERWNESESK